MRLVEILFLTNIPISSIPGHGMPTADEDMQSDDGSDYDYLDENTSQDKISSETNQVTGPVIPTTLGKAKTEYFVNPGESVAIQCPVMNRGQSIVMWYKGENVVTQDKTIVMNKHKRYNVNSNWSLVIDNVENSDEDYYTCKIVPNNLSLKAKLFVIKAPSIRIIQDNRDVTEQQLSFRQGDRIRLDCMSSDQPQPKFIWSLNGTRLDRQHGVVVEKGVLEIESAGANHSDLFQCLAENAQGLLTHKTVSIHVECEFI